MKHPLMDDSANTTTHASKPNSEIRIWLQQPVHTIHKSQEWLPDEHKQAIICAPLHDHWSTRTCGNNDDGEPAVTANDRLTGQYTQGVLRSQPSTVWLAISDLTFFFSAMISGWLLVTCKQAICAQLHDHWCTRTCGNNDDGEPAAG